MAIYRQVMWATALLALASAPALAQGRGHGRGRESAPGQVKKEQRQEGRGAGEARPERRGASEARQERRDGSEGRPERRDFNDDDRMLARNWYFHNRDELPPGLRDRDRLPPAFERRLAPGYVIEPAWRPRLYPVPAALVARFGPPPPRYRYAVLGGNIVLLDPGYRVMSVIGLNFMLGR